MKEQDIFTQEIVDSMSPEDLKTCLSAMSKQYKKLEKEKEALTKEKEDLELAAQLQKEKIAELEFLNKCLNDTVAIMKQKRFGSSSEKNKNGFDGQMELKDFGVFNEAEQESDLSTPEPEYEEIHPSSYVRRKQKGKKETDLSVFPEITITNTLKGGDRICPECGTVMKKVSVEVTRRLRFVPAHLETEVESTYVYSCPVCEKMKRAEKTPSLLKGSIATPSLVAAIMNAKYVNGMPLYRQKQEYERYGVHLETNTMANWMIRCAEEYLYPIYGRMREIFLTGKYSQCDETRVQVLDEPEQKAETKNWMWVYMSGKNNIVPEMVLFQYERTRGGYHPKEFLEKYQGYITCDGYQPYHNLPETITVTGCWAHSRRRYNDCLTILKKEFTEDELKNTVAYRAMAEISKLYKMEKKWKELTPEERYTQRQQEAKPVVEAYFAWLKSLPEESVDSSSRIGNAIHYALNQKEYLCRYLEDGHLPIDNNDCERSLKTFCTGRRNWLFCKSIQGAEASAVIYSLTETAKLHGLRPYSYLSYVLDEMRKHTKDTTYDFIDGLLPWSKQLPKQCLSSTPFKIK